MQIYGEKSAEEIVKSKKYRIFRDIYRIEGNGMFVLCQMTEVINQNDRVWNF